MASPALSIWKMQMLSEAWGSADTGLTLLQGVVWWYSSALPCRVVQSIASKYRYREGVTSASGDGV